MSNLSSDQLAVVFYAAERARLQVQPAVIVTIPDAWDTLPADEQRAVVNEVHDVAAGTTAEQKHEAWRQEKLADDWTYGPVKDAAERTHPELVPYAELPADRRDRDALLAGIIAALR